MSCDFQLMLKYPMIMQKPSLDAEEYYGYIRANNDHFKIRLRRNKSYFKLEMNEDLLRYEKQIKKLSRKQFSDAVEYLDGLTEILSSEIPSEESIVDHTSIYRKTLQEYSELKQFYFNIYKSNISADLKTIEIVQMDERDRQHRIIVDVNYNSDEKLFKIRECDLPISNQGTVFEGKDSLIALYEGFMATVDCPKMQTVLNILDEIDRSCWVIDPEKPTRKDLYRRIMLDTNLSVVITFNPSDIRDLPQVKFLGPHKAVERYSKIVARNFINWNPNEDILNELLKLLEIENFPPRPKRTDDEELLVNEGECCICFSLRLNERMPDIVCQNSSCNQFFHVQCLYEWLCSLNSRKYYYEIYGQCPNCEKTIRCPLPTAN